MKRKTQRRELAAQFYRGNRLTFAVAAFAALTAGSLNLILSWLIQQLIDTASGMPPSASRARATANATAMGSVQPRAGLSSARRIAR